MESISVAIIDDEENARYLLKKELLSLYDTSILEIFEADSLESGIQLLREKSIQLLFLDIELGDGTGFHLLESLNGHPFSVIFVTAYNDFALRAFEFLAFAYLVKPFKKSDLKRAVDKYLKERINVNSSTVSLLSESIVSQNIKKIVLSDSEGFRIIPINEIIYIVSDNNYSEFHVEANQRIICSKTLKDYERLLREENFFRCHKSYLINLNKVIAYSKNDGGVVTMSNKSQLPVGRRRMSAFKSKFLT
jgi:two-component system LytT family response regulator